MNYFHSIILLLFIIHAKIKFSTSKTHFCTFMFPDMYTCEIKNLHYNKTNYSFTLLIEEQTKILVKNSTLPKLGRVGFCKISFGFMDINRIYELDIRNSSIEEMDSDTFHECEQLKRLILPDNKIEVLEDGLLNRNSWLEKIDLSNNRIKKLSINTFDNLDYLKELYLSGNRLKTFPADLVKPCYSLQILRIDSNDLFDLNGSKIVEYLQNLKKVAFNNNQLRCDRVKEIIEKFKSDIIIFTYEGEAKKRIEPTKTVESIMCLDDIPWAAANYLYMYEKISEI